MKSKQKQAACGRESNLDKLPIGGEFLSFFSLSSQKFDLNVCPSPRAVQAAEIPREIQFFRPEKPETGMLVGYSVQGKYWKEESWKKTNSLQAPGLT